MANLVVSAVVDTIVGMLGSAAVQAIGLIRGVKDELNSLERTVARIKPMIHDAEIKQRKNKQIEEWLRDLKDAAYDAEDILERIATEDLKRKDNSERGTKRKLESLLSWSNPLLSSWNMASEVKKIREKLDAIAAEGHKFQLGDSVMENRFGVSLEISRQTMALVNESEIYGRDEEKEMIMEKLLLDEKLLDGFSDQDCPSVYAIWGMGGLGKTTLAQMLYNDKRIESHFGFRIWVCVSHDFRVPRIVRAILESIEGVGSNINELDPLQRHLQERLTGRRFLLVLDDVWNEECPGPWDELKQVLRCGSKGSMVMVTTRSEKVASLMTPSPSSIHHISCLAEDHSWSLFRKRAFGNEEGDGNLIALGQAIVKKCGGVPLAIKALGSLMRLKTDEREWLAVKESEIWHLSDDENAILPALRFSYDNLPPQMRQCFAYCCIFPKDYLMEEKQLIQLWMANGYTTCDSQPNKHLTGHLIIKQLIWRSFLQEADPDFRGNRRYKMHNLMHDLASSVMKHESYILEQRMALVIPETLRHLCFYCWVLPDGKSTLKLPIHDSLLSIIVQEGNICDGEMVFSRIQVSSFLSNQKYLRALDVSPYTSKKFPDVICKLEHLRYLAVGCDNMKSLPESLTHLHNLQTLRLKDSKELLELPKGMKMMKNLWFVEIENFDSLICTPPGLGDLTCLHGLSIFIVCEDAPHQIYQLQNLDLEGELSIKGLDNVRNLEDARSAKLMAKMNLTSLSLYWERGIKEKSAEHYEEVLQGLQPHQNLEKISVRSYHGSRFPNWMSTVVYGKLKEIRLEDCPRCEHLPALEKLSSLTHLYLSRMDSFKCWSVECYGNGKSSFPALISLEIIEMPNLEQWTVTDSSTENFPCLERLRIQRCPKLTGLPKLPNLRRLEVSDGSVALVASIKFLTSLTDLCLSKLDVLPEGLLQNHKALKSLRMQSLPMRTLPKMLDNLSALKALVLEDCSNLEVIPEGLKYLSSLDFLLIDRCDGLISFPATLLEGLPSLRRLGFFRCKNLKPLSGPLKQAPPLHELWISDLPELEYLPESMQLLKSLRVLKITLCEGLSSLPNWLGSLESLLEVKIRWCEKLKSLPDGFESLKSLTRLKIDRCTEELEKRCKKPNGEDWPKISHIPIIKINDRVMQRLYI